MGAVLTADSVLICPHGGRLTLSSSTRSLTVDGATVLVLVDLVGATISGCTTVDDTSHGLKHCSAVTSTTAGASTALTIAGKPVALDSAQGLTDGLGPGPVQWQVRSAGQNKLTAH